MLSTDSQLLPGRLNYGYNSYVFNLGNKQMKVQLSKFWAVSGVKKISGI